MQEASGKWQRKLWLPCTRQGLEWWWDLHPWRFFNSAGQGTDQLALALQPVLLGAEGWRGDLQSSSTTKILLWIFVWFKDQAVHCYCQPQSTLCPTQSTQICNLLQESYQQWFPSWFPQKDNCYSSRNVCLSQAWWVQVSYRRMHRKSAFFCLRWNSKSSYLSSVLRPSLWNSSLKEVFLPPCPMSPGCSLIWDSQGPKTPWRRYFRCLFALAEMAAKDEKMGEDQSSLTRMWGWGEERGTGNVASLGALRLASVPFFQKLWLARCHIPPGRACSTARFLACFCIRKLLTGTLSLIDLHLGAH